MKTYYTLLDAIAGHFRANGITYTVRNQNPQELTEDKFVRFPVAIVNPAGFMLNEHAIKVKLSVMCLGQVDYFETDDEFLRQDNSIEVLNDQMVVMLKFLNSLKKGALYDEGYHLDYPADVEVEAINFAFNDKVIGWSVEVDIVMPNDITHCVGKPKN